jgi:uncharacterized membrane protein YhaH (DUF805 family)
MHMPAQFLSDLTTLNIVEIVSSLVLLYLIGAPCARILQRTGHSGWWVLLGLIPVVNILALWTFANKQWRRTDGSLQN